MKKVALFLLLTLYLTNSIIAQNDYRPMITDGNQWNVLTHFYHEAPMDPDEYWFTTKYTIGGEIIQNDISYHEIINQEGERKYLIREDVDAKKVYFGTDLMYDFSLEVKDTFNYFNDAEELLYTLRLDSIKPYQLEDDTWTRIFYFSYKWTGDDEYINYHDVWIEGVGNPQGLDPFQPLFVGNLPVDTLLCFKNYETLLISSPDYETCDENSTANSDISIKEIAIYPNPVSTNIQIDLPIHNAHLMVKITNVVGNVLDEKEIYTSEGNLNMDVSNLSCGLYFLSIMDNSKLPTQHFMGRFIVER